TWAGQGNPFIDRDASQAVVSLYEAVRPIFEGTGSELPQEREQSDLPGPEAVPVGPLDKFRPSHLGGAACPGASGTRDVPVGLDASLEAGRSTPAAGRQDHPGSWSPDLREQ